MNSTIVVWDGIITFVIMLFLKIPVKKCTYYIAKTFAGDSKRQYKLYRRANFAVIVLVFLVSLLVYSLLLLWLESAHFKLCCSMKLGAVAMSIYALFEQLFGKNGDRIYNMIFTK